MGERNWLTCLLHVVIFLTVAGYVFSHPVSLSQQNKNNNGGGGQFFSYNYSHEKTITGSRCTPKSPSANNCALQSSFAASKNLGSRNRDSKNLGSRNRDSKNLGSRNRDSAILRNILKSSSSSSSASKEASSVRPSRTNGTSSGNSMSYTIDLLPQPALVSSATRAKVEVQILPWLLREDGTGEASCLDRKTVRKAVRDALKAHPPPAGVSLVVRLAPPRKYSL